MFHIQNWETRIKKTILDRVDGLCELRLKITDLQQH